MGPGLAPRQIWAQPTTASSETYKPGCTPFLLPSEGMPGLYLLHRCDQGERKGFGRLTHLLYYRTCSFEPLGYNHLDPECSFRAHMYRGYHGNHKPICYSGHPRPFLLVSDTAVVRDRVRNGC